jgi:UDP-N-acetylmuramoylalanine--D-glutamate ligase
VLELSSFQLALLRRSPHVAVVTNITPNHLDRHGTMDAYIAAKRHIVEHQRDGDHAVLNWGDPLTRALAGSTRARVHPFALEAAGDAACAVGDWLGVRNDGRFVPVLRIEDVPLLGRHNVENVLAAIAAAGVLGVDPEAMSAAVKRFRPAPHRLQVVGEQAGVRYIDDSIATSPARAIVALQAIDAPVILIAGGRDKRLPWDDFARVVSRRVRALLLIGEAADDIEAAVRSSLEHEAAVRSSVHHEAAPLSPDAIHHCDSLETAVDAAQRVARPGDVVLLSPACTSYDMFRDFEERGHAFARAVSRVYAA